MACVMKLMKLYTQQRIKFIIRFNICHFGRVFCVPHPKYENNIKVSKDHKKWKKKISPEIYILFSYDVT